MYTIAKQYYSNRKTDKKNRRSKEERTIVLALIAVFIIMCLPILYLCKHNLKVSYANDSLCISGLYGIEIPIGAIDEVELCQSLPEISLRTNGLALAEIKIGHFRTKEGEDIMLFAHSNTHFVRLKQNSGNVYYLSYKEEYKTNQLYNTLRKRIGSIDRNG